MDPNILKKIARAKASGGDASAIKTWSRASEIAPEMVGFVLAIHNGRTFTEVRVTEEMVGHRLGEFSPTRKFVRHGGKLTKELEQKAAAVESAAKAAAKPAGK